MIPESTPVVLDTGVLVQLCRGGVIANAIEDRYHLRKRRQAPMVPAVCAGELLAFGRGNGWGAEKLRILEELLSNLLVLETARRPVLEAYAEVAERLRTAPIGQNDLWVAAAARAAGAVLLTTDTDFDRLHPDFIQREYIDQRAILAGQK
ncbi:MAG: PIN domain-containing protein [Gemmatimonadetes bacterium]|nr:PIN domain-containing protein [Gemmatimonadota bacterium]